MAERIAEDSGFSSLLYRLHLTGVGVPATLIAKLPAQSEARGAMEMLGGYRRELAFYRRRRRPRADGARRTSTAARMADDSADFVLLLEDLAATGTTPTTWPACRWTGRGSVSTQLAGLHAWSTGDANAAALEQFPSIDTPIARDLLVPAFGPGWQIYRDKSTTPVSGRRRALRRAIRRARRRRRCRR